MANVSPLQVLPGSESIACGREIESIKPGIHPKACFADVWRFMLILGSAGLLTSKGPKPDE
jgi:hypothetical protein